MSDWRAEVALGTRPAVIFNATGAENGKRFIVASTDVDSMGAIHFFRDFAGFDIPVSTAARLSASFPYVSPEARASNGPDLFRVHVGDGGYYDNSGILSALEWVKEAQPALSPYNVLFITIEAGPSPPKPTASWSWQRQITAPLETLLSVRTSSQDDRDRLEMELEQNVVGSVLKSGPVRFRYSVEKVNQKQPALEKKPGDYCLQSNSKSSQEKMSPKPYSFSLQPDESSPLSWHLNKLQKQAIYDACQTADNLSASDDVCKVLKGDFYDGSDRGTAATLLRILDASDRSGRSAFTPSLQCS